MGQPEFLFVLHCVTARANLMNIVRFGLYRTHGFVSSDASPLLSLTSQNAFNMLAPTLLIRPATQPSPPDVGSYNPPSLRSPTTPFGTTGQLVRSALIPNVTAQPNMLNIVRFGPYRPHVFVPGDASPLLSLTSQNTFNMLEPALLIRLAIQPSPTDVGSHKSNALLLP